MYYHCAIVAQLEEHSTDNREVRRFDPCRLHDGNMSSLIKRPRSSTGQSTWLRTKALSGFESSRGAKGLLVSTVARELVTLVERGRHPYRPPLCGIRLVADRQPFKLERTDRNRHPVPTNTSSKLCFIYERVEELVVSPGSQLGVLRVRSPSRLRSCSDNSSTHRW